MVHQAFDILKVNQNNFIKSLSANIPREVREMVTDVLHIGRYKLCLI